MEEDKLKAGDRVQLKGCDRVFVIAAVSPDEQAWANLIWFDENSCFFRREQCVPLATLKKWEDPMIAESEAQKKEGEEEKDPKEHELHIHKFPTGGAMIGVNRGRAFVSVNVTRNQYVVLFGAVMQAVDALVGNDKDDLAVIVHHEVIEGKSCVRLGIAIHEMSKAFWGPYMERQEMQDFLQTGCDVERHKEKEAENVN